MRTIGTALQSHLDSFQTTVCWLLKINPQKAAAFGVTSLDQDVTYDDGGGALVYSSATGANVSSIESSSSLSVNNSEALLLIGSQLSEEDIASGVLDYADFHLYRINWADTGQGHYLAQSGRTGQIRSHDELAGILELRSLSQQLKQNFLDLYSLTCRARFGSQVGEELFPCNFDASTLLQALTVDAVGVESDRAFTADASPSATGPNGALPFTAAQITFTSGANNGLTVDTETVDGAVISLRFPAPYAIEVGDTFNIRPDCMKLYAEDCIAHYDNALNFRGEPYIPINEEGRTQTPGATIPGIGTVPTTPDPVPDPSPVPPDTPPDVSGAVSWESFFGQPFGDEVVAKVTKVIPSSGIAIWFQVPVTGASIAVDFNSIELTGEINPTQTGSVNTGVLDFSTAPVAALGLSGGITGGINKAGQDISLTPGNIYIFNAKNDTATDPNWIQLNVTYVPD